MNLNFEWESSEYIRQPVIWLEIDNNWIRSRLSAATQFGSDCLWIARIVGAILLVISVAVDINVGQYRIFVLGIALFLFIIGIAKYRVDESASLGISGSSQVYETIESNEE